MARYPHDRKCIDQTSIDWRDRCLVGDGSLLNDGAAIWTASNVDDLYQRIVGSPLVGKEGGGTFDSKLIQQLDGCSAEVRQLAGELLLVYLLFPSSISSGRKNQMLRDVLQTKTLDQKLIPVQALSESIGNPGTGFNMRRDLQIGFLLDFTKRIKELDSVQRKSTLGDPWATQLLAEEAPDENRREMMHILFNLLHPDEFERIASGSHKREIAKAFAKLRSEDDDFTDLSIDRRILAIREQIEALIPTGNTGDGAVDFYAPPLRSVWNGRALDSGEGTTDLEALAWKKQLILYGPPGTGKTYQAKQIAEQLISNAALQSWGIATFLHEQEYLEEEIRKNFRKIQLHPGYGYSDFIRGVRLNGNETRYEPGALCKIVSEMNAAESEKGLASLPVVLVLDEINRTDLSAMLGEAFSLLELDKRRDPIQLPGINPGEPPAYLHLPDNLFVIGTMNEIDQSVETLDFALRRRFLWRECRFDREALLEIIRERWDQVSDPRFTFEDALPQLEQFADNAVRLNAVIASVDDLGEPYEIGHSHFADITQFLSLWLTGRSKTYATTPLWGHKGQARPPITDLWARSLKPLLEQYLAGIDQRDKTMKLLENAYFGK
jgi:5-methylcytosine-specific restriction protein B